MNLALNAAIDLVGLVIVLLIYWNGRGEGDHLELQQKLFDRQLLALGLILVVDIPAWLIGGASFLGARALHIALNFIYYALQIVYAYCWFVYTVYWVAWSDRWLREHRALYAAPLVVDIALLAVNLFTGWIYSVNDANVYSRGPFFGVCNIFYYIYIACATGVAVWGAVKSDTPERRRSCMFIALFMVPPIVGTVLAVLFYGLSLLWPFCALSLLMVYLNVQQRLILLQRRTIQESGLEALRAAESAARLENELMQNRVAIMLSQIQPHFLYNALAVIQELCHADPPLAERATEDFSRFLRGNIDSLSASRPIGFERELEHTNYYLALEKLRFMDRLRVEYDIRTTDFMLPTLTLQPIVENAVRYGVTKREEGGTVSISTARTASGCVVRISDDGVGFDPEAPHEDGRSHIGIQNVRDRLARMCGGSLEITSEPGRGTVAVITIPTEG